MFESHKNMALSAAIMCLMVACVCDIMNKKGIPGRCIYIMLVMGEPLSIALHW